MLNEPREVQRFVDPANLPRQQGGYHPYQHEDFVKFFQVPQPYILFKTILGVSALLINIALACGHRQRTNTLYNCQLQ